MKPPRITALRKALGLTQVQMAQLLGVHPLTVSRWERGVALPPPYPAALLEAFEAAQEADPDLSAKLAAAWPQGWVAALALVLCTACSLTPSAPPSGAGARRGA